MSSLRPASGTSEADPVATGGEKLIAHVSTSVTPNEESFAQPEFLDRLRQGDRHALDQVIRAYGPRVERMLRRFVGARGDMDDLLQTVFFEFCTSVRRFRGDSSLLTYLRGVALQVARRARRPTAWERRRTVLDDDPASNAQTPYERTTQNAKLEHLQRAIDKLSEKKRTAFLLWALEGVSVDEIAVITGAAPAAVRGRIYHAQQALKKAAMRDPYLKEMFEGASPIG